MPQKMTSRVIKIHRKGKLLVWTGISALAMGGFVHCLRIADIGTKLERTFETFPDKMELYREVSSGMDRLNTIPPLSLILYCAGFILVSAGALIAYRESRAIKALASPIR
jgi:hypothetical protein